MERLVKRGRADGGKPPVFKAYAMRLQKELMRFRNSTIYNINFNILYSTFEN